MRSLLCGNVPNRCHGDKWSSYLCTRTLLQSLRNYRFLSSEKMPAVLPVAFVALYQLPIKERPVNGYRRGAQHVG